MNATTCADLAVSTQRFSTDNWPEHERRSAATDFYASLSRQDLAPLPDQPLLFRGTIRHLPQLRFVSASSMGLVSRRRAEHISSEDILVTVMLDGERLLEHGDQQFVVRSGEAVVSNDAKTSVTAIPSSNSYISLRIPAKAVSRRLCALSHRTQIIRADNAVLHLLRAYLRSLDDVETPAVQQLAASHVRDLVAMMMSATPDGAQGTEARGARAARLHAVKEDIARSLEYGDVSVGAVAARHRVTPRYVQKLFESDGTTFSEYVLEQRLARVHRALSDPSRAGEKITGIAFAAGFGDLSHFYRAFRRRYGALPTDVRASARRDH